MALTLNEVSQRVACAPVLAVISSILLRSNRPARVARGLLPVRAKNPVPLPLVDLQASQPAIKTDQDRSFSLAAARTRFWKFSLQLPERQPHELIELLKYARDQRRSVSIHAQFLALVSLFGDWFLLRHHGCCKAGRTPNYEDRQ